MELSKTKLDSIDKVVDYVRCMSRDVSEQVSSETEGDQFPEYFANSSRHSEIDKDALQFEKEMTRQKQEIENLENKIAEMVRKCKCN